MNLPPQTPSSEEPEQQPVLHSSEEETPTQPSLSSDQLPEEPQQEPVDHASEEPEQLPAPSPELPAEESPAASSSEPSAESPELPVEEPEQSSATSFEPDGTEVAVLDGDETFGEDSELDEDEAFESEQSISSTSQPTRSGVFIHKGILIAVASAVVVVALLAVLLVGVTRPKDPPTDWIASYTPPAGSSSTGKVLYYLHWTNQNGELKGQMQLAAYANGAPQSLTVPATGLYNRDNHIIYVVVTINGQADTLMGKINDTNDTLSLNPAGVTTQPSQFVFHMGTADDFKQATKKLATGTKTT